MELFEDKNHSFVIRIWSEEDLGEDENDIWRGHITHVISGKRNYLQSLDDISHFIQPYLLEKSFKDSGKNDSPLSER